MDSMPVRMVCEIADVYELRSDWEEETRSDADLSTGAINVD